MQFLIISPGNKPSYLTSNIIEGLYGNLKSKRYYHISKLYFYLPVCFSGHEESNHIRREDIITSDSDFYRISREVNYIIIFNQRPFFPIEPGTLLGSPLGVLDGLSSGGNVWDKCVYIDESEYVWNNIPRAFKGNENPKFTPWLFEYLHRKCGWYFKRECYPEDETNDCIPLPFSSSPSPEMMVEPLRAGSSEGVLPTYEKKTDVMCSFPQQWTGYRQDCKMIAQSLTDSKDWIVDMKTDYPSRVHYLKAVAASYIVIDSCGGGHCNARAWEVQPYCVVLFRQHYPIVIPDDYDHSGNRETEMMVEYADPNDLYDKLLKYLKNKPHLLEMGKRAQTHFFRFHSSHQRVKYILDHLTTFRVKK